MAPRAGSSVWDHKADKDLLLAVIDTGALKGIDWKAISERMIAKGYTFSHEACRQHFQKIRKESRNDSTTSVPSTPSKPSVSKSTSQKRSKDQQEFGYGPMGEDDDEIFTPSKRSKVKGEAKLETDGQENRGPMGQSASLFKVEDLSGKSVIDLDQDDLYNDYCA